METIAWIGVGAAGLIFAVWFLGSAIGMLRSPIGRAIVLWWAVLAVTAWGVLSAVYLAVRGA